MTEGKQVNELAWKTRIHFDKLLDRGFSHGQITIMNIMISIDRYSEEHGPGSSFSIMAACFNAVMSGGNVDITKIRGFQDVIVRKKGGIPEEEEIEIDFDSEMNLSFDNISEDQIEFDLNEGKESSNKRKNNIIPLNEICSD